LNPSIDWRYDVLKFQFEGTTHVLVGERAVPVLHPPALSALQFKRLVRKQSPPTLLAWLC
jgi:hypothetical protein